MVPSSHPDFTKRVRELERIYRHKHGLTGRNADKPLPPAVIELHMAQAVGEILIRDWRNVEQQDGTPIPFEHDLATTLLRDIFEFRADILDLVSADGEQSAEEQETLQGNS